MDYITSNLHAHMHKKNKLRVKGICMECLTWVLSFYLDLDLVPMHGLN